MAFSLTVSLTSPPISVKSRHVFPGTKKPRPANAKRGFPFRPYAKIETNVT
jgi:hypothetical protein